MSELTKETRLIKSLGYVLKEANAGSNGYRAWTTYLYAHPNGRTLLYNDSDDVLIVRDSSRHIILEGRFNLNSDRLKNL